MLRELLAASILLVVWDYADVQARTWTDDSGQFSIEAEFVSEADGKVRLRKPDGSIIEVSLAKLSANDRKFVEEQKGPKPSDPFETAVQVPSDPAPPKPEQTVLAEGVGTSRHDALKDAFRNAVRQVVGAVLDSETLIRDDKIIDDKILTNSDGIIGSGYEQLDEKNENGLVRVKIKASVQRGIVVARLKAANVTVREIDGKALFAEAATKLEAQGSAIEMLSQAFAVYPSGVLAADVKGKPTVNRGANGKVALTYELTVKGDYEKYDQWQKKVVPLLAQVASAKGEKFLVSKAVEKDDYELSFEYFFKDRDAFDQKLSDNKSLGQSMMTGFRTWNKINEDLFESKPNALPDKMKCVVLNVGRNQLCDRTTWKWFNVERELFSIQPIAVDVLFMDKDGVEITRDSIEFSDELSPGFHHERWMKCDVLSPFWLHYSNSVYSPSVSFPQTIEVTTEELESIASTKCVVRPSLSRQ